MPIAGSVPAIVHWAVAVAAVTGCLVSCVGPGNQLPEIPVVAAEEFPEAVRGDVEHRIRAARDRPEDPWSNGDLATILHAHGRVESALALYERAESLSEGQFRWSYLRGVVLQEAGRAAEAAASFRLALQQRPYAPARIRLAESLAVEDMEAAITVLQGVSDLGENEAAAAYVLGQALLGVERARQAIPVLQRSLALAPGSGAARYALAMAHRAAGNESEADRNLAMVSDGSRERPALEDPFLDRVQALAHDEHYFLNFGKSLEAAGKLAEAIRAYRSAIELDPEMATAHANLVGALGQVGDFERAQEHYERARSIDSGIEELHNNWGVLMASQENPSAAEAAFRRALEINPSSAKAHANLGVLLTSLDRDQEARIHFRDSIANDPRNRPARMNLGFQALQDGRVEDAVVHLEAALRGPEDGSGSYVRYLLGRANNLSGRPAEARQHLDAALRLAEPANMEALVHQIRTEIDNIQPD